MCLNTEVAMKITFIELGVIHKRISFPLQMTQSDNFLSLQTYRSNQFASSSPLALAIVKNSLIPDRLLT